MSKESNEWDTVLINSWRQKFLLDVNNPTKSQYAYVKEFSMRKMCFFSFINSNIGIDRNDSWFESIAVSEWL